MCWAISKRGVIAKRKNKPVKSRTFFTLIIWSPNSMVEASAFLATQRHAVVTGSNKGIGFEICRQLASKGVTAVLTSRDEKRGLEALRKLKEESCPALLGEVVFHWLHVTDSASIDSLVDLIRNRIGKLDILVHYNMFFVAFQDLSRQW
ncbi:(+)-neomenthol dehydrogenase-like [Punica granatum]|uniref:(+)-neomenthol dehydrogenase-like n=1 Tax=Punica granatum TaxID=22663 RepID=A0A6P8C2Y7_PUNGR|nr:(+)-neomenthol dehydrogenase-like [Punica granatum]